MPRLVRASYVKRTSTRIIQLDCRHTIIFRQPFPELGDDLWCPRCQRDGMVTAVNVEWRIICEDCARGKRFGQNRETCYRFSVQHRRKNPGHIVRVYLGEELKHRFGVYDAMPQLPMVVGDVPPF